MKNYKAFLTGIMALAIIFGTALTGCKFATQDDLEQVRREAEAAQTEAARLQAELNALKNPPAATLGEDSTTSITGTTGTEIETQRIIINLTNVKLKAIAADQTLASWVSTPPAGITVKAASAVAADDTTVTLKFEGTPTAANTAAFTITIPADMLNSNDALGVAGELKWAITAPAK
jgi:type 1 fimbria pilin